jgi:predicted outer membrane repeat protein
VLVSDIGYDSKANSSIPGTGTVINGALIYSVDSNITLDNTTVERATSNAGGALYLESLISTQTMLTLMAANFYNCSALTGDGGAVYVAQNRSNIVGSIFNDNSAFRSGGAIYYSAEATEAVT